ncbi:Hypothetical protein R9X50_00781900 [Acrodontium crateriforme]|uniref:Protein phosphatase 4 core regulatory subunit R2 n=1 Tax=Acrodontium crateriforme TaxID=150365 RepID=A0AAQ3ME58_9PEZI|nr:Hypothetical protein R9X50_00781900 [Acrodontium crateriforme]
MASSDEILERVARDGSIDFSEWPRVLESMLKRLHDIVHNEFPLPTAPIQAPVVPAQLDPDVVVLTPQPPTEDDTQEDNLLDPDNNDAQPTSQHSTKENDEPTNTAASRLPVPDLFSPRAHLPIQPPDAIQTAPGILPPDLLSLYNSSTQILSRDFAQSPPYTIQRLAEMVLHPAHHYRFLPAYLRAIDRIVSVSSPVSNFPLPCLNVNANGGANGFLSNGDTGKNNGSAERDTLGSDESLGGALLTPIPWLRNLNNGTESSTSAGSTSQDGELHSESTETIEGPNGAGSIETVSVTVNGVPSTTSVANASLNTGAAHSASPTLSEQSNASSSSSTSPEAIPSTNARLRQQGGVTQGQLLRQEQEAGVVPVSQNAPRHSLIAGGAVAAGREPAVLASQHTLPSSTTDLVGDADAMDESEATSAENCDASDDRPHARGPDEIGAEDIGTQHGLVPSTNASGERELDIQAAVGRPTSPLPPTLRSTPSLPNVTSAEAAKIEAQAEPASRPDANETRLGPHDVEKEVEKLRDVMSEINSHKGKDGDGDVVLADAHGK